MIYNNKTQTRIHSVKTVLQQFDTSEACENWLSLVNSCIYGARQIREIYQVLPYTVDFNPLSKTALRKCCFILIRVPVNIWNHRKAQK